MRTKSPRCLTLVFLNLRTRETRLIHKPIRDDDDNEDEFILEHCFPTRQAIQRYERSPNGPWAFSNCHVTSGIAEGPAPDHFNIRRRER